MRLGEYLPLVEQTLDEVLPCAEARPAVLAEAMRYAVGTGGKRIRPLLCLGAAMAVGGSVEDARYPAAAIELLHNYTLVHDDLPAMDNDVERRGKPTVWKRFGEANAILAGDALLSLAFEVAAKAPRQAAVIVRELGEQGVGVVRGQVEDIEKLKSSGDENASTINFIYRHKTADLFMAAVAMGGLVGGGDAAAVEALKEFALHFGLAFQFEDDLLDGDSPYDRAKTEHLVAEHTSAAIRQLARLRGDASWLADLAESLVGRSA